MKKIKLIILMNLISVITYAQKLNDGTYNYTSEELGIKTEFKIEGDKISSFKIKTKHTNDTLYGRGTYLESGGDYNSHYEVDVKKNLDVTFYINQKNFQTPPFIALLNVFREDYVYIKMNLTPVGDIDFSATINGVIMKAILKEIN